MSGKSFHSAGRLALPALVISIDLELPVNQLGVRQARTLESATDGLAEMLTRYRAAATWAVADPVHSAATRRLLELGPGHELALLGDSAWVGREAGRRRFARELTRRLLGARAAGIPISTLVCQQGMIEEHVDLLVKHGITGVRDAVAEAGAGTPSSQPQPLCYGLWACRGSMRMPYPSRWRSGSRRARRSIDRAIKARTCFHLVVDGPRFGATASARRSLERVLRHAQAHRAAGQLQILTVAQLVQQISPARTTAPTRSILRATA